MRFVIETRKQLIGQRSSQKNETEVNYIFHIDGDETTECNIVGVKTEIVMQTFIAYGIDTPLNIIGSFKIDIVIGDRSEQDTFYVIKDGTAYLLSKRSAISLGVLQVGPRINQIKATPFPKFNNVLVEIPIDDSIRPVAQLVTSSKKSQVRLNGCYQWYHS